MRPILKHHTMHAHRPASLLSVHQYSTPTLSSQHPNAKKKEEKFVIGKGQWSPGYPIFKSWASQKQGKEKAPPNSVAYCRKAGTCS
jgi:hypothetical protein